MGDFQLLTHAATKQQLMSPLHILVFSGPPPHQPVSQSSVGLSEGWDRLMAEWRNSLGVARPSSASPCLCLWYAEAGLSTEKERSVVKAAAPLPGDPGLWPSDTHLSHQPISACASPGASCDPFVSETIAGQRKVSGAATSHPGLGRVLRIHVLMAKFYIVPVHARAQRDREEMEQGQKSQPSIPI